MSQVLIGNREWMKMNNVAVSEEVDQRLRGYEEHGQTTVLVAIDGKNSTSVRDMLPSNHPVSQAFFSVPW